MKKHLKSLLVLMLVVPCMIALSACGGVGKPANGDWIITAKSAGETADTIILVGRTFFEAFAGELSDAEYIEALKADGDFSEIDFTNITTPDQFWAAYKSIMVTEMRSKTFLTISGGNTMTAIVNVSDDTDEPDYQTFTSTFSVSKSGVITLDNQEFIEATELAGATIKYKKGNITISQQSIFFSTTIVLEKV